jgi:hypothetical protein
MKLLIFPEAHRKRVEAVVAEALGRSDGPDGLTVIIVCLPTTNDWTVHAAGLGDPVLEHSLSDVIKEALRDVQIYPSAPHPAV